MRSIYESEFRQENLDVVSARDGKDGLRLAIETDPDLIITGLILTKLNGFELIKEIRQNSKDRHSARTPIVVVSALSQKQDIDEALSIGADLYLPKDSYSIKQAVKESLNLLLKTRARSGLPSIAATAAKGMPVPAVTAKTVSTALAIISEPPFPKVPTVKVPPSRFPRKDAVKAKALTKADGSKASVKAKKKK